MKDCGVLDFLLWEMALLLSCLLVWLRNSHFVGAGIADSCGILKDMAGDILFHTTCEMAVRK